jgi:hypothetical protein
MSGVRGRPFEPGNKFGKGRPRGSRNKTSAGARELLNDHAEPLVRKALVMALQGDTKAMQMCLNLVVPVRRDQPQKFGRLPLGTAEEISKASAILAQKVASGQVSVSQALGFNQLIETRRRAFETEGRLLGELNPGTTIEVAQLPEWQELRETILRALEPYPTARQAVLGAISDAAA